MITSDTSPLFLGLHPDNYALYAANPTDTEADKPTTLQLQSRRQFFPGRLQGGPRVSPMIKSSLLDQVSKIQGVNAVGDFPLAQIAQKESVNFRHYSSSGHGGGGYGKVQNSDDTESAYSISEDIDLRPSFNPPANTQSRIIFASVAAKTVEAAGIITDGVFESFGYGFSAVCSATPQTQRACDHVSARTSSLALATAELVKEQWEGSDLERMYNSTSERIAGCWKDYVETTSVSMFMEGIPISQIEQYHKDVATTGRGLSTLVFTAASGWGGAQVVTGVKKSMQLIKATAVDNVPKLVPSMKKVVAGFNDEVVSTFSVPQQIKSPIEILEEQSYKRELYIRNSRREIMDQHRLKYDRMMADEMALLRSSKLALKETKPTAGLATNLHTFYTECNDCLIKGVDIGPKFGRINHTLVYQISEDHMMFYVKKRHYSHILRERNFNTVHSSFNLTLEEQMDFITKKAYELAQNTPNIKYLSYAYDHDFYAVASALERQKFIIEARGSLALVKPDKHVPILQVKLTKPK